MTTTYMDVSPNGVGVQQNHEENKVHVVPRAMDHAETMKAPAGLPGIKKGTPLRILQKGKTSRECPYGGGLPMYLLEHRVVVVFTKKQGMAWMMF